MLENEHFHKTLYGRMETSKGPIPDPVSIVNEYEYRPCQVRGHSGTQNAAFNQSGDYICEKCQYAGVMTIVQLKR